MLIKRLEKARSAACGFYYQPAAQASAPAGSYSWRRRPDEIFEIDDAGLQVTAVARGLHPSPTFRHGFPTLRSLRSLTRSGMTEFLFLACTTHQPGLSPWGKEPFWFPRCPSDAKWLMTVDRDGVIRRESCTCPMPADNFYPEAGRQDGIADFGLRLESRPSRQHHHPFFFSRALQH